MAERKDSIHIPLPFDQALSGLMKVKPTKDMPRTGKKVAQKKKSPENKKPGRMDKS
jgi:hypothetical protein